MPGKLVRKAETLPQDIQAQGVWCETLKYASLINPQGFSTTGGPKNTADNTVLN